MMNYEICEDTLAILPFESGKARVIETHGELIVNKTPMEIIEDSCLYFGSTYDGRHTATKYLLGISYKSPIIIEESRNIIFFPTNSPRQQDCCWISLKNIIDYKRRHNNSIIYFAESYWLEDSAEFGASFSCYEHSDEWIWGTDDEWYDMFIVSSSGVDSVYMNAYQDYEAGGDTLAIRPIVTLNSNVNALYNPSTNTITLK